MKLLKLFLLIEISALIGVGTGIFILWLAGWFIPVQIIPALAVAVTVYAITMTILVRRKP